MSLLPDNPAKVSRQRLGVRNRRALLTQRLPKGVLVGLQLLDWTQQDPARLTW